MKEHQKTVQMYKNQILTYVRMAECEIPKVATLWVKNCEKFRLLKKKKTLFKAEKQFM